MGEIKGAGSRDQQTLWPAVRPGGNQGLDGRVHGKRGHSSEPGVNYQSERMPKMAPVH